MNIKSLRKLISVIIIFLLLLQPLSPVFADEIADTTPTPTESPSPTPGETVTTPEPTVASTKASSAVAEPTPGIATLEATNSQEQHSPDATDQQALSADMANSGDEVTISASDSATINVAIDNNNNATVEKNLDLQSITGENSANNNITPAGNTEVTTGEATVTNSSSTVVNTNIVGTEFQPIIVDFVNPQSSDLDFSSIAPCSNISSPTLPTILQAENTGNNVQVVNTQQTDTTTTINNTNNANIQNNIDIKADSGGNQAIENIGGTSITTGDANIQLNLFNMANTNLVGNCFFFGVINLFGSYTGDIILPYELGFLTPQNGLNSLNSTQNIINTGDNLDSSTASQTTRNITVENNDDAAVDTKVNALAISGGNKIQDGVNFGTGVSINTGNATTKINLMDLVNTSIYGGHFLLLRVNHFGNWQGNLIGPEGTSYGRADYFVFFLDSSTYPPLSPSSVSDLVNTGAEVSTETNNNSSNNLAVQNNNTAQIQNNINLLANSGGNEAGKYNVSIKTGNASITANILNFVNTNIVGNNWFFAVINVFDDFIGNIIFPRPDVTLVLNADRSQTTAGDEFNYYIAFANQGRYKAEKTSLTQNLPAEVEILSAGGNGIISGNSVTWNLGDLVKNQSGQFSVRVRARDLGFTQKNLISTASITTITDEPNKDNNNIIKTLSYLKQAPPQSSPQHQPQSSSNGGGSNSSGSNTSQQVLAAQSLVVKNKVKKVKKSKKKLSKKVSKKLIKKSTKKVKKTTTNRVIKRVKGAINVLKKKVRKIKRAFNDSLQTIFAKIQKIYFSKEFVFSQQYTESM